MKDNYCVIMGGGIGSRFWPFSRETMPKQFLDFFGTGRSLLQQTFDRFSQIIPVENIFIATNELYKDPVKNQLPELRDEQILLEPTRRNTAPCIAYASYRIRAINPRANIVVTPADHLILQEYHFLKNIQTGLNFVSKFPSLLTLGVKPSRPETGYGYIQSEDVGDDRIQKIKAFTEKPNYELARIFYESGEFYWNSGVFIWNVNSILEAFSLHIPDITTRFNKGLGVFNTDKEKAFINEEYPSLQNVSIDYGVMEKADNVYMLVADFGWSDLGTWGSLYDLAGKDENHNATLKCKSAFYESKDNLVSLAGDKLAVIQGLEDYIIAESDNILLICKKSEEQRIKQFVTDVNMKYGDEFA
ncbi:MAG: mannose-1-phosphate guanylyltransferase [Dysgonamonadaceae bacterium]|jgi:mannose-1-phosphate guanylyltransferase|nr:mannose-1-phosphate guanylyltransferase [Dysgonamonadaceae bacterium]